MPASTAHGYPYPAGSDRLADGDDMIRQLAETVDSQLGTSASGKVTVPIAAVNTPVAVTVTFPAGRFGATPSCMVTAVGSAVNQIRVSCNVPTATSFDVRGVRSVGAAPFDAMWLAVGAP